MDWQTHCEDMRFHSREGDFLAKLRQCSTGNFLDSCSKCAKGFPQGPLYSKLVQRQGCQVPIALVISLCKCVTSKKALIYLNAYAIRPRFTFKALLFNLHQHRAYSKPHNISSSPPRLPYISIRLIRPGLLYWSGVVMIVLERKQYAVF